jgi:hypothetical protein
MIKTKKKTGSRKAEDKLWKDFSEYIRRRDAKKYSGGEVVKCITCPHVGHWKNFDCGHGISRKHKATKFHEFNNHAQCKGCNGFGSGKQFEYMLEVDKRYGAGTVEKLLIASRQICKWGEFEYEILHKEIKQKIKELKSL